jgi:hypothetical protein
VIFVRQRGIQLSTKSIPTQEATKTERELLEDLYRRQGFIVLACNYPHDIGEIMQPEEDALNEGVRWRVSGESTRSEFILQFPENDIANRPFFYRIEAMD